MEGVDRMTQGFGPMLFATLTGQLEWSMLIISILFFHAHG